MRGTVVLCVVAAMAAPSVFAQSRPLNPTVRVLEKPQSIVPPECIDGLAPAAPRPVEIASVQPAETSTGAPPPSSDLRTRLRRVQSAVENGDYGTFKSAIADARASVARFPAGGEKQAAGEVLQVYADIERLWDHAQTSPTGSFFDASSDNGALITAMRRYPDFPRAVAASTMNIGGQTIYPTTETRRFLAEDAARRLSRLGVRTPSRAVQETPAPMTRSEPAPRTTSRTPPAPVPARETVMPRKSPPKIAQATPRRETTTRRKTTTVRETPRIESPRRQDPIFTPVPQPAARTPVPVPTPMPVPAPTRAAETTDTEVAGITETTATEVTDTTSTTAAVPTNTDAAQPAETPKRGLNLIFAIILIVIGLGVLIVLFRSSD